MSKPVMYTCGVECRTCEWTWTHPDAFRRNDPTMRAKLPALEAIAEEHILSHPCHEVRIPAPRRAQTVTAQEPEPCQS